jgi:hypothetical protein
MRTAAIAWAAYGFSSMEKYHQQPGKLFKESSRKGVVKNEFVSTLLAAQFSAVWSLAGPFGSLDFVRQSAHLCQTAPGTKSRPKGDAFLLASTPSWVAPREAPVAVRSEFIASTIQEGSHRVQSRNFLPMTLAADQELISMILDYLSEMKVNANLFVLASAIPSNELHFLSDEEIKSLGIVEEDKSEWKLREFGKGLELVTSNRHFQKGDEMELALYCVNTRKQMILSLHKNDEDAAQRYADPDSMPTFYLRAGDGNSLTEEVKTSPASFDRAGLFTVELTLSDNFVNEIAGVKKDEDLNIYNSSLPWAIANVDATLRGLREHLEIIRKNCVR